jgi:hypothetical protein
MATLEVGEVSSADQPVPPRLGRGKLAALAEAPEPGLLQAGPLRHLNQGERAT